MPKPPLRTSRGVYVGHRTESIRLFYGQHTDIYRNLLMRPNVAPNPIFNQSVDLPPKDPPIDQKKAQKDRDHAKKVRRSQVFP